MADVELLPLPEPGMLHVGEPNEWFTADQMHAYARANVEHHTAPLQAENERLLAERDALAEGLSDTEKDVAVAQAVEFAEYVERQAKGAMRDAAKRFLSLPYSQEVAGRMKDALRYRWLRENPHVRVDQFCGKYRASTAAQILTDWLSSYDEAIDAAIAAVNGSS